MGLKEQLEAVLPKDHDGDFLTAEEGMAILMAVATARGNKGFTEDEVVAVTDVFVMARLTEGVLSLLVKGTLVVDIDDDGELWFHKAPPEWAAQLAKIQERFREQGE